MRFCDFCGQGRLLTVESRQTAHVICSRCVWACAERLVEQRATTSDETDPSALGETSETRAAS